MLVVEDEALVAMELAGLLQQQGCTVMGPASSIGRALALLQTQRPDAALLDLNLNGQSALPVAAVLYERGVPCAVISGYTRAESDKPELTRALWLTKPVSHPALVRTLKQMLTTTLPG